MNIKKIFCITLALLMTLSLCANAKTLEFKLDSTFMSESDETFEIYLLENAPYAKNQRTMVPVRIISERFGADVDWNGKTQEITIIKGDKNIVLTLGRDEAVVNGEVVTLDAAPEAQNGRTMVPIRFVSETLNMNVEYVPITKQILITDEEPVMEIGDVKVTVEDYRTLLALYEYSPSEDNISELVAEFTDIFKNTYAVYDYIKSTGYVSTGEFLGDKQDEIGEYTEFIHTSALSAPLARLMEREIPVIELTNKHIESEEVQSVAEDIYLKNYITAKHILISTENRTDADAKKLANQILSQIKGGMDFDMLMNLNTDDPGIETDPNGYTFTKGEMVKAFENAAFALKEGEVSGLVKSEFGYHIIKREPLAVMDYYSAYAISDALADEYMADMAKSALENVKITVHKTNEEIVKILQ